MLRNLQYYSSSSRGTVDDSPQCSRASIVCEKSPRGQHQENYKSKLLDGREVRKVRGSTYVRYGTVQDQQARAHSHQHQVCHRGPRRRQSPSEFVAFQQPASRERVTKRSENLLASRRSCSVTIAGALFQAMKRRSRTKQSLCTKS